MPKRILIAILGLFLTGCALMPPEQLVDKPILMPMAKPLGPTRRIVQQLTAVWSDRQESLLAILELDAQHIAMAGLSNDGLSLFNLSYDGNTLTSDKSPLLPAAVSPEFFVTDLQLVYWPISALQKNLPSEWHIESSANQRRLYFRDKMQTQVNYPAPDPVWPKEAELVSFQYHYRLKIKTISYDLIPE